MDGFTERVSSCITRFKQKTLVPYYSYMQSARGHTFMRKTGPVIAFLFYLTQIAHAVCFYQEVAPVFYLKYGDNFYATLWVSLGWLLWLKVTYTYYWVSRSNCGSPKELKTDPTSDFDPNLPVDESITNAYS